MIVEEQEASILSCSIWSCDETYCAIVVSNSNTGCESALHSITNLRLIALLNIFSSNLGNLEDDV